jgi:dynein light chain roadblock-type
MVDLTAVEETVKRLLSYKGVIGLVVLNNDGIPIRTTFEQAQAVDYAALVSQLALKSRQLVREMHPGEELQFLRLRTKKQEIMIATAIDMGQPLTMVVVQEPSSE